MSRGFWKIPLNICERMRVKRQVTLYYENSFTFSDLLERSCGPLEIPDHTVGTVIQEMSDWRSSASIGVSRVPLGGKKLQEGKRHSPSL